MESTKPKILLVDDEADICEFLQFNLQNEGYEVDIVSSGEEALTKLTASHRLILLDVMMSGMSGFKVADELRKAGNQIPIIFLTAKDTENDMLTGFSVGGDDYISKPFSIKEVLVRVKSVLRRQAAPANEAFHFGEMKVDLSAQSVSIKGQAIDLTRTEYNILLLLVQHPERVFSRAEILERGWGEAGIVVLERTVDVHIARLRKKLGDYGAYITNRTGYGYQFLFQNPN